MRIAVLFLAAVSLSRAADMPMTLVSEDEAETIHSAIVRKEAWTQDSVRRLRADADRRVREGPWTVTAERPKDATLNPHDYYSEASYWWPDPQHPEGPYVRREGQVNPARFTANRNALNAMCDSVLTLGTAAFFLDDPAYARRAARLVHHWFVDPESRMNPNFEHAQAIPGVNAGRPTGIVEGRALVRAIQGMEFLAQTNAWDAKDQAAVRAWFGDYLRWLTESDSGNEARRSDTLSASWWAAQAAAVATFTGNRPVQQLAFREYRERVFPRQIHGETVGIQESGRARGVFYSTSNLEAFAITCRIAQVQGLDLWDAGSRGATLATAIDKLEPYLREQHSGRRQIAPDPANESLYFLAFAGMGLKRPHYVDLFQSLERPEGAWYSLVELLADRWEAAGHQTRH